MVLREGLSSSATRIRLLLVRVVYGWELLEIWKLPQRRSSRFTRGAPTGAQSECSCGYAGEGKNLDELFHSDCL